MNRVSKFHSLVQVEDSLQRARLLKRVRSSAPASARTTVLIAPAGFGKTLLLAQISAQLAEEGVHAIWLNCNQQDRQPDIFFDSIERAYAFSQPEHGQKALEILSGRASAGTNAAFFIDEYELAASRATSNMLRDIVMALPPGVQLFIACREFPYVDLTELALQGRLRLIDAAELKFTLDETRALLTHHMSDAIVDRVQDLTDGWAFVLQLIRLGVANRGDGAWLGEVEDVLPTGQIFSYFASEVWRALPADLREFLMEVAPLAHIDASAADWLRQRNDSVGFIGQLSVLHPIVVVDPLRSKARLHPLLREFLGRELACEDPAALPRLHSRAAEYFARKREVFEAVGHALESDNIPLAVRIIEDAGGLRLGVTLGMGYVRSLLGLLPASVIREHPRIRLMELCVSIVEDNPVDNSLVLDDIQAMLEEQGAHTQPDSPQWVDFLYTRCVALFDQGERVFPFSPWQQFEALKTDARARQGDDPRLLGIVLIVELLFTQRSEDFAKAELRTEMLESVNTRYRFTANNIWLPVYKAQNDYHCGRLSEAEEHLRHLLTKEFDGFRHQHNAFGQMTFALLGRIHYARGELEDACNSFERLSAAERAPVLEISEGAAVCHAFAEAASGRLEAALDRLGRELLLCHEQRRVSYQHLVNASRVELLCRAGKATAAASIFAETLSTCVRVLDAEPRGASRDIPWCVAEAVARARFYLEMTDGDSERAQALAETLREAARLQHRTLSEVSASILAANAAAASGRKQAAREMLTLSLSLCGTTPPAQLFIDHGADLLPMLRDIVAEGGRSAQPGSKVLRVWEREFAAHLRALNLLTARENEVLVQLSRNQSTKQIARELMLSPETVKYHLKAIFAKLQVSTRDDAVKEAHRRLAGG